MQPKIKNLLVMLLVMFTLVGTITAIMTLANLTSSQSFVNAWISSFTFAFLVLLPLGGVIFATISKLINRFLVSWSNLQKNVTQAVLMALVMESIMAIVTMFNTHTYESLSQYSSLFFNSLLYALPVGLTFSCLMVVVIKPKLEKVLTNQSAI
ncbi:MAG: hypothetical protein ACJAZB_001792 [Psychrosphaera sp.]|jgi:hypothetical protein